MLRLLFFFVWISTRQLPMRFRCFKTADDDDDDDDALFWSFHSTYVVSAHAHTHGHMNALIRGRSHFKAHYLRSTFDFRTGRFRVQLWQFRKRRASFCDYPIGQSHTGGEAMHSSLGSHITYPTLMSGTCANEFRDVRVACHMSGRRKPYWFVRWATDDVQCLVQCRIDSGGCKV